MGTTKPVVVLAVLLTLFVHVAVSSAEDEVLTNATVLELHKMGFGDEVLIEKIRSSAVEFDLSLEGLRALKDAGIPQIVIAEMINRDAADRAAQPAEPEGDPNDPLTSRAAGIYLLQDASDETSLVKLEPSVYTQARSGGMIKHIFTYGVSKIKSKAVLPGTSARLQIADRRPTFYFYFEETETGLSYQSQATTSPAEFILAEFDVQDKKGHRELVVGQMNAFGAQSGAMDKTVRQLDYDEVSPGIFRVTPRSSLSPGEYGFYYAGAASLPTYGMVGAAGGSKVFDFGIR